MSPDRLAAEAFILALTGCLDLPLTWQLINDVKSGERFAVDYHVRLDQLWNELVFRNRNGIGIFVMVNAGDGGGRSGDNVVELRALFIDDDAGTLGPDSERLRAIPPSFAVRSKRGWHFYWLLEPDEPLDGFTPAQVALAAHFGTDPAVKDLPRVMRVPGFFHMKAPSEPFMVEMHQGSGSRYTIAQVLAAYPPPPGASVAAPKARGNSARARRPSAPGEGAPILDAFRGLKLVQWAMESPVEVSYEAWRGIATNIAAVAVDDPGCRDDAEDLFQEISACDEERYDPAVTYRAFEDALKSAMDFGPMTFAALIQAEVPETVCSGAQHAKAPVGVARMLAERRHAGRGGLVRAGSEYRR